jgi:hypothetical protein
VDGRTVRDAGQRLRRQMLQRRHLFHSQAGNTVLQLRVRVHGVAVPELRPADVRERRSVRQGRSEGELQVRGGIQGAPLREFHLREERHPRAHPSGGEVQLSAGVRRRQVRAGQVLLPERRYLPNGGEAARVQVPQVVRGAPLRGRSVQGTGRAEGVLGEVRVRQQRHLRHHERQTRLQVPQAVGRARLRGERTADRTHP